MPPDPGPKKLSPLALVTLASSVVKVWLRPCIGHYKNMIIVKDKHIVRISTR